MPDAARHVRCGASPRVAAVHMENSSMKAATSAPCRDAMRRAAPYGAGSSVKELSESEPMLQLQVNTRRRSESAYIRQVNFLQLLYRVGREMVPR